MLANAMAITPAGRYEADQNNAMAGNATPTPPHSALNLRTSPRSGSGPPVNRDSVNVIAPLTHTCQRASPIGWPPAPAASLASDRHRPHANPMHSSSR